MLELKVRQVEQVFAAIYEVPNDRILAFRARLEHLRKKGCPSGLVTGRGKVATFKSRQLLEIATALALIDVGVAPDHASSIVLRWADRIHGDYASLQGHGITKQGLMTAALTGLWPQEKSVVVAFSMGLLSSGPSVTTFAMRDYPSGIPTSPTAVTLDLGTIWARTIQAASFVVGTNPSDVAGIYFGEAKHDGFYS